MQVDTTLQHSLLLLTQYQIQQSRTYLHSVFIMKSRLEYRALSQLVKSSFLEWSKSPNLREKWITSESFGIFDTLCLSYFGASLQLTFYFIGLEPFLYWQCRSGTQVPQSKNKAIQWTRTKNPKFMFVVCWELRILNFFDLNELEKTDNENRRQYRIPPLRMVTWIQ